MGGISQKYFVFDTAFCIKMIAQLTLMVLTFTFKVKQISTETTPIVFPTAETTTGKVSSKCRAVDAYSSYPDMDHWCEANCAQGYCPSSHCTCKINEWGGCMAVGMYAGQSWMDEWCVNNCEMGYCPPSRCNCPTSQAPTEATTIPSVETTSGQPNSNCRATSTHSSSPEINSWCETSCANGYCPSSICMCDTSQWDGCKAVGIFAQKDWMDKWCKDNCRIGDCPSSRCKC